MIVFDFLRVSLLLVFLSTSPLHVLSGTVTPDSSGGGGIDPNGYAVSHSIDLDTDSAGFDLRRSAAANERSATP